MVETLKYRLKQIQKISWKSSPPNKEYGQPKIWSKQSHPTNCGQSFGLCWTSWENAIHSLKLAAPENGWLED